MSFGISSITNANGEVVIDQNFRNLRVFSQGNATVQAGISFGILNGIIINTGTIPNPVVFIRDEGRLIAGGWLNGSEYRCIVGAAAGVTIPWFVTSLDISGDAGGGFGLAVFDPQGRTVFSSNHQHVRVATGLVINQLGDYTTQNVPVATGLMAPPGMHFTGGYCNIVQFRTVQRTSATNISVSNGGAVIQGNIGPGSILAPNTTVLIGSL